MVSKYHLTSKVIQAAGKVILNPLLFHLVLNAIIEIINKKISLSLQKTRSKIQLQQGQHPQLTSFKEKSGICKTVALEVNQTISVKYSHFNHPIVHTNYINV